MRPGDDGAPFGMLDGVIKEKAVESGAGGGNLSAELTPGQGDAYVLIGAMGYHDDDGGNRSTYWAYDDGTTEMRLNGTAAVAANTFEVLHTQFPVARPIVLTYGQSLHYHTDGLVAGHKAYMKALVAVIRGMEPWSST